MDFTDILRLCRDNLKRRKGRTFLTALGVFIGCVSIVVMISIGGGIRESQDKMLADMGDLTIIEVSGEGGSVEDNVSMDSRAKLDDDVLEAFRQIPDVKAVMPKMSLDEYFVRAKAGINDRYMNEYTQIVGVDTSVMDDMGFNFIEGAKPGGKDGAVAGQFMAYTFTDTLMPEGHNMIDRWASMNDDGSFDTENMPEPYVKMDNTPLTLEVMGFESEQPLYSTSVKVTGVIKEDYGKGWETSEGLYVSTDLLKEMISMASGKPSGKTKYSGVMIKASDFESVEEIEKTIRGMGYSTNSMAEIRKSMEEGTKRIQMILGGLGAISLFVAAIGITNTMIMSISERTREIGIMKALGCRIRDIRMMFLTEAGMIGLLGGICGTVFSIIASLIVNALAVKFTGGVVDFSTIIGLLAGSDEFTRVSVISPGLVIFAIAFSISIGLISGYYPAGRAVKIPALEAIKHE